VFAGRAASPLWLSQRGDLDFPEVSPWSWEGSETLLLEVAVPFSDGESRQYLTMESGRVRELIRWVAAYDCCWSRVVPVPVGEVAPAADTSPEALLYAEAVDGPAASGEERSLKDARPIRFFYALDVAPGVFAEALEIPQVTPPEDAAPCGPGEIRIVSFQFDPLDRELSAPVFLCADPARL